MTKYTFLLHHTEQEKFLEELGQLGIVDVSIGKYDPSVTELSMIGRLNELHIASETLRNSTYDKALEVKENILKDINSYLEVLNASSQRVEEINTELLKTTKELTDSEPWGDFSKEKLAIFADNGITLHYYVCSSKQYDESWESKYPIFKINDFKGASYFILVHKDGDDAEVTENLGVEVRPPHDAHSDVVKMHKALIAEKIECMTTLLSLNNDIAVLDNEKELLSGELHFEKIKQGNESAVEGALVIIKSWVPTKEVKDIDGFCDKQDSVISFKDKPTLEDNPPILLKNNKFAKSSEMITSLYSLPNYQERDMTPYFAPFFIFFVGICLGDVGYGLVILLLAIIAKFKMKNKSIQPALTLTIFCSLSAIAMGFFTGAMFGLSLAEMPIFASIKNIFIEQNSMFGFAIGVGVIQIIYATILRTIFAMQRYGFKYGLAHLGWLMLILTGIALMGLPMVGVENFTSDSLAFNILMGISLVLMFFFANPDKNIFVNLGIGLYGLYNNVTGLLGDVLSYIRLFALGLSSCIIASVFNDLAVGMAGDNPYTKYIIMAIILLIGHGINLFMAAIGSFVHPLRLTFVEFYKNVGFEGGGRAYMPFSRKTK